MKPNRKDRPLMVMLTNVDKDALAKLSAETDTPQAALARRFINLGVRVTMEEMKESGELRDDHYV